MKPVRLIAVFAENKPGQMVRITEVLLRQGVNIRWVALATSERMGVIKLLVNQTDLAFQALQKQGFAVSLLEVLAVEVADEPRGLHAVVDGLTRRGINIENASGFVANHRAVLLLEVGDPASARQHLSEIRFRQLSEEEMLKL